jgi:dolichol-phosphate hexosyltransferase
LNEEKGINLVVQELRNEGFTNLLVVDGHSNDDTVEVTRKLNVEIVAQEGKGKGGAIITAINKVNTNYFVVIDADYSYESKDIQRLFDEAASHCHVIGKRMDYSNIRVLNRFGNKMINILFNFFFGSNLHDVCSGLYLLNTSWAKGLDLDSEGFDIEVEIAAKSAKEKSVTEVPISFRSRIGIQKLNPLRDGFRIISKIFGLAKRYEPTKFWIMIIGNLFLFSCFIFFIANILKIYFK